MKDYSWIWQAIITAALTTGTTLLLSQNSRREDHREAFIQSAETVASRAIASLYESQDELNKLVAAAEKKDWNNLKKGEWAAYHSFQTRWRREMIVHHFAISRHFGQDSADEFMHVAEIDIQPPAPNLASPSTCAPNGEYDVFKLSEQIACEARSLSLFHDIERQSDNVLETIKQQREMEELIDKRLRQYDKASAAILRAFDKRLSALGKEQALIRYSKS